MPLSKEQVTRYSRHLLLPEVGRAGQERLAASKVLLVGAGGLGCPAALYLAAAGVGRLGIADSDAVDLTNLQRQVLHWTADVGRSKVESAAEKIKAINPDVRVDRHPIRLSAANFMETAAPYDLVIDGADNFPTKFLANDACVLAGKPLLHAGILRFSGQMMMVLPGRSACYRCVFDACPPAEAVPSCAEAGVIGAVAGVMGSLLANEAVKFLAGIGEPCIDRLLSFDAKACAFREIRVRRNPECPVCGPRPSITELRDEEALSCS